MSGSIQRSSTPSNKSGNKALLTGGLILTVATMFANAGNYALNLVLGRWLTPAEFADANFMVTIMLLVTAIAIAIQLVVSKFVASYEVDGSADSVGQLRNQVNRVAVFSGLALLIFLCAPATIWNTVFNTESAWLFVILGLGMPFYLLQATERGVLQGKMSFGMLAATFIAEVVARLALSLGLVAAGFGVVGATTGLAVSFFVTWVAARFAVAKQNLPKADAPLSSVQLSEIKSYIVPVATLLFAQIVINNGDVIVSKRYFDPTDAGVYAALALVGRAVFFLSWSAVTALFPAASANSSAGNSGARLLRIGIGVIAGMCIAMCLGVLVLGDFFLSTVLGPEYGGQGDLLFKYAIATSMFAVANYIASHKLAESDPTPSRFLLSAALLQTVLIFVFNQSAETVINSQIVAMAFGLLGCLWLIRAEVLRKT